MYKDLEKFFISPDWEVFSTTKKGLHEELARDICKDHRWDWRSEYISAADYLQESKGFLKITNYGGEFTRSISISKRYINHKRVMEVAEYIQSVLKLRLDIF